MPEPVLAGLAGSLINRPKLLEVRLIETHGTLVSVEVMPALLEKGAKARINLGATCRGEHYLIAVKTRPFSQQDILDVEIRCGEIVLNIN